MCILWGAVSSLYVHLTEQAHPISRILHRSLLSSNTSGEASRMNCMSVSCDETSLGHLYLHLLDKVAKLEWQEPWRVASAHHLGFFASTSLSLLEAAFPCMSTKLRQIGRLGHNPSCANLLSFLFLFAPW
jgi:hypothetical protein